MKGIPNPRTVFGNLPVAIYQIDCRIDGKLEKDHRQPKPPDETVAADGGAHVRERIYWGSAWRGLLGWELLHLLCPFPKRPACKACLIRRSCPYYRLMEEQREEPGIQEAPRGYVLYPTSNGCSDYMTLNITLFGDCIRYAPAVFKAFQNGEATGIGASRAPFTLMRIRELTSSGTEHDIPLDLDRCSDFGTGALLSEWLADPAPCAEALTCRLSTPVRLRKNGKYLGRMDWSYFFATLIRRLESLGVLFASGEFLGKERFLDLMSAFSDLRPNHEYLRWHDYSRWSNRQRRKVPMGGLIGEARFESDIDVLHDWFAVAQLVHVGKGAAMGLGKIEVSIQ